MEAFKQRYDMRIFTVSSVGYIKKLFKTVYSGWWTYWTVFGVGTFLRLCQQPQGVQLIDICIISTTSPSRYFSCIVQIFTSANFYVSSNSSEKRVLHPSCPLFVCTLFVCPLFVCPPFSRLVSALLPPDRFPWNLALKLLYEYLSRKYNLLKIARKRRSVKANDFKLS